MRLITAVILVLTSFHLTAQVVTIKKRYYTIVYDTSRKLPIETYYMLVKKELDGRYMRTAFIVDPSINKKYQRNKKDYNAVKGYDKGHLVPNDDFRFTATAQRQSMVYTNTAPQVSSFNRIVWRGVEEYCRKLCSKHDSIRIITGIFPDTTGIVWIPSYFWKIVMYKDTAEYFVGRNVSYKANDKYSSISVTSEQFITIYKRFYGRKPAVPKSIKW